MNQNLNEAIETLSKAGLICERIDGPLKGVDPSTFITELSDYGFKYLGKCSYEDLPRAVKENGPDKSEEFYSFERDDGKVYYFYFTNFAGKLTIVYFSENGDHGSTSIIRTKQFIDRIRAMQRTEEELENGTFKPIKHSYQFRR